MSDTYHTIAREAQTESKVKGSRFIGETYLVSTAEEALEALEKVRKREYSATHHCYAWVTGRENESAFKYSDDGEPNGTAGKPIYDVVTGAEVTNVLCVVTRYFGGTKLGTGGLVRAYGDAAREAMAASGRRQHFVQDHYQLTFEFSLYDKLLQVLHALKANVEDSQFTDQVSLRVAIRQSRSKDLIAQYIETTSGRGEYEQIT